MNSVREILDQMADDLNMPDPRTARHHSRIAVIDYARAYRGHHSAATLLDSAYLHLEKTVRLGAYRERIEGHFYRIRQRSTNRRITMKIEAVYGSDKLCWAQNPDAPEQRCAELKGHLSPHSYSDGTRVVKWPQAHSDPQ